jgi:hypothetical protein
MKVQALQVGEIKGMLGYMGMFQVLTMIGYLQELQQRW